MVWFFWSIIISILFVVFTTNAHNALVAGTFGVVLGILLVGSLPGAIMECIDRTKRREV